MKKLLAILLTLTIVLSLAACGGKSSKDGSGLNKEEYQGYQFAGADPWDGEVAITIRSLEDTKLGITFTETLGDDLMIYEELEGDKAPALSGNTATLELSGELAENTTYEYTVKLELKDGKIFLTYESGRVFVDSKEGGSAAYQAEALEESAKTVELEKQVLDK